MHDGAKRRIRVFQKGVRGIPSFKEKAFPDRKNPVRLRDLDDVKLLFSRLPHRFVGVGISGWMRILPAFFVPDYRLVCYRDSLDLRAIEKTAPVFCLEREAERAGGPDVDHPNTRTILHHPLTSDYLQRLGRDVCLILYKSYPDVEGPARDRGWRLVGCPANVREPLENKHAFREALAGLGLPAIPGETLSLAGFDEHTFDRLRREYGEALVFQFPEITQGGGRGTFLIRDADSFRAFMEIAGRGEHRGCTVNTVTVTRFMKGEAASIAACVTRHGTISTPLQTQLMDEPAVVGASPCWGIFCGHSWGGGRYDGAANETARQVTERVGGFLARRGYRGIFGIDFIVDREAGTVHPVECNLRYTGAFPMLSLLHLKDGRIPLDVFHLLEYLPVEYEADVKSLNQAYADEPSGAHVILFNRSREPFRVRDGFRDGVWRYDEAGDTILHRGDGIEYRDMDGEDAFLVTDGVSRPGTTVTGGDEFSRVCRLLFPEPVADGSGRLTANAVKRVEKVYAAMGAGPRADTAGP